MFQDINFFHNLDKYKLQITPLKFGDDCILHLKVLKFRFYPLDISDFKFYSLYFKDNWILLSRILECLDFTP